MTTDLEVVTNDPYEKIREIEEIGLLHLKGYKNSEIQQLTNKGQPFIREAIKTFKQNLEKQVDDDPWFLEKVQYNTLKTLAEMDEISKEAWESVAVADREGILSMRNQALKLALDVASKKAQLLQLMGGTNSDNEYIARMQKAETVNSIISKVVRDVIADCPVCRDKARVALREAFALMDDEGSFMGAKEAEGTLDYEDAIIIEE